MKVIYQKDTRLFQTSVMLNSENKIYIFSQKFTTDNEANKFCATKEEAIKIAMAILKDNGILPEVTTIAELEKQGKL